MLGHRSPLQGLSPKAGAPENPHVRAPIATIKSLFETHLTVRSLERSIAFYRDVLGLPGLMPFFTVGPDETRAWTIRRGWTALEASGEIHSDIQRGFIRAEIVGYGDLIAAGGMAETKKNGTFRREGKTYVVQDGVTSFASPLRH